MTVAKKFEQRVAMCQKKRQGASNRCIKPPPFCGEAETKMTKFGSNCIVLQDELYRDKRFIRKLTPSEEVELIEITNAMQGSSDAFVS
ncbi:unnamed protein product [Anisakis simplex]|uniref:Pepsin-I3 domain-containing protein n=1 Tax=Anisakis simplex TaxID=6269 RepID=A0A0M3J4G0_ANISI|nr:unnamed protein product [Anisakis simplex]